MYGHLIQVTISKQKKLNLSILTIDVTTMRQSRKNILIQKFKKNIVKHKKHTVFVPTPLLEEKILSVVWETNIIHLVANNMSLLHTIKEQEKGLLAYRCTGRDCNHEDLEKHYIVGESDFRTSLIAIFEENIKRLEGLKKEPTPQQISAIEKYGNGHTYNQGAFDAHNNTIESEIRYYQHLLEGLREE